MNPSRITGASDSDPVRNVAVEPQVPDIRAKFGAASEDDVLASIRLTPQVPRAPSRERDRSGWRPNRSNATREIEVRGRIRRNHEWDMRVFDREAVVALRAAKRDDKPTKAKRKLALVHGLPRREAHAPRQYRHPDAR